MTATTGNDEYAVDVEAHEEHEDVLPVPATLPVRAEHSSGVTLFGTDDPVDVVERAQRVAKALADVIEQRKLYTVISGKKHVRVEGWTLLGSMLGVFPITEWTRTVTDSKGKDGWEARVIAQTRDGHVVGTREAMCSRSESRWQKAEDYAIRSMAQTRAVSGALASPLRFVMELAGYEGTPEAEMHASSSVADVRQDTTAQPKPPRSDKETLERFLRLDPDQDVWAEAWIPQALHALFGKVRLSELTTDERKIARQKLASAVMSLEATVGGRDFPPPTRDEVRAAFAHAFDGIELEGPAWRTEPGDEARPPKDADSVDEDIPFGEEQETK